MDLQVVAEDGDQRPAPPLRQDVGIQVGAVRGPGVVGQAHLNPPQLGEGAEGDLLLLGIDPGTGADPGLLLPAPVTALPRLTGAERS
ncbi:hypothetical protein GCM10023405_03730 [Streptomonospora salina]